MVASPATTSFQLPPAEGGPTILAAEYDAFFGQLDLTFSEDVQWASVPDGDFTVVGNVSGTAQTTDPGAQGPLSDFAFGLDSTVTGTGGTLSYAPTGGGIVSVATGLPLLAFTGFPVGF